MDNEKDTLVTVDEEQKETTEPVQEGEAPEEGEPSDEGEGDKPISNKEFAQFQKQVLNSLSVLQRHSKKSAGENYKPKDNTFGKDDDTVRRIDKLENIERKRDFGYEFNLSPKEVDLVFKFDNKPNAKTLENPFVMGGLEKLRSMKRVQDNIPRGGGSRTFNVGDKTFNELQPADKTKNFAEFRKSLLNK